MIGSSVTELRWLDDIPAGRPTLVVAEGLLMYLHEEEVRRLVQRLIDRFPAVKCISIRCRPWPRCCQGLHQGIITWGIRDARRLAAWHPRLRFLEQTPALAGYEHIPSAAVRMIYALTWVIGGRGYDVLNRFEY